jgi:hypothetical protein
MFQTWAFVDETFVFEKFQLEFYVLEIRAFIE